MVKEIKLSRGMVAIVDDDMYDFLNQWKWFARTGDEKVFYACRTVYVMPVDGKRKAALWHMHRIVAETPDGMVTDHINGNTLDNRRENLRVCMPNQNVKNMQKSTRPLSSPYKGVSFHKQSGKWQASIKTEYKQKWLGNFENQLDAAKAYNLAAIAQHGEYAKVNEL